jgi:hypothetical protein
MLEKDENKHGTLNAQNEYDFTINPQAFLYGLYCQQEKIGLFDDNRVSVGILFGISWKETITWHHPCSQPWQPLKKPDK